MTDELPSFDCIDFGPPPPYDAVGVTSCQTSCETRAETGPPFPAVVPRVINCRADDSLQSALRELSNNCLERILAFPSNERVSISWISPLEADRDTIRFHFLPPLPVTRAPPEASAFDRVAEIVEVPLSKVPVAEVPLSVLKDCTRNQYQVKTLQESLTLRMYDALKRCVESRPSNCVRTHLLLCQVAEVEKVEEEGIAPYRRYTPDVYLVSLRLGVKHV